MVAPGQVAFQGTTVLRLHVAEGGGSVFALPDPLPLASRATTGSMRGGAAGGKVGGQTDHAREEQRGVTT